MKKPKLKLSRETVRALTPRELSHANGGMQDLPTRTCTCTMTCQSVCASCEYSDCCLYSVKFCG